jgi:CubicO group peptidase (beta-lactamase class C family)
MLPFMRSPTVRPVAFPVALPIILVLSGLLSAMPPPPRALPPSTEEPSPPPDGPRLDGPRPEEPQGADPFAPASAILSKAVSQKAFPGCVAVVGTADRILWKKAFGSFDYEGGPSVDSRSVYDLASLTKVVGTTSVILALVRDGLLSPSDPVGKHVPEFAGGGKEKVRLEHLLTHSAGLPAWRPLYREARGLDAIVREVAEAPLEYEPGSKCVYSDLGFILLGEVAARAGGRPLCDLEQELVFDPLGLRETTRRPLPLGLERIVPTERVAPEAGHPAAGGAREPVVIRGIVHDENAAAAGGETGHAGLFSTADDLAIFAAELLRGCRGESRTFPAEVLRTFVRRRDLVERSSRALGWDTPSEGSSAGARLGRSAFGHTGFTGTSLWVDPDLGIYVLLLSNRVHPGRENLAISAVRREIADAVICALRAQEGRGAR